MTPRPDRRAALRILILFSTAAILAGCNRQKSPDLATERAAYPTHLLARAPSPQPGRPFLTVPQGAQQVTYQSGNLKLVAWITTTANDKSAKHPAVVYCHGGFAFGEDDWEQAGPFYRAGYVVMMPWFRGENGNPGNFEMFYGEVDDAIAAGNDLAKLPGVDPDKVFIAGHSAGGTIAALVAEMPSPFAAAAAFGATTDMAAFLREPEWAQMAPFNPSDPRELRLRSAKPFIGSLKIPLHLVAGDRDRYAIEQMYGLDDAATQAGKTCTTEQAIGNHFSSVAQSMYRAMDHFRADTE